MILRRLGLSPVATGESSTRASLRAPISVVIPAYNREALIERALASVAAQDLAPAEVIVVDDCSTDATAAVAEAAGARVIRLERNQGAATARLVGVRAAENPWVGLLDSDDEWLPWMLSTLWPRREGHVLVAGASLWIRDGVLERYEGLAVGRAAVLTSPKALIWPQNFVPAAGSLVERDAFLRVSPEAPQHRYSEDFATWVRLLEVGTGLVVSRPVVRYQLHATQKASSSARLVDQHRIAATAIQRWGWGRDRVRRRMTVDTFDARRSRGRGVADTLRTLRYAARPSRALAVVGVTLWRRRQLALCARVTPEGDLPGRW